MAYRFDVDRPHEPDNRSKWQESDCYWFFDNATGVGAYHRIGQYPNLGTGQLFLAAFKKGGTRYLRQTDSSAGNIERWSIGQRVDSSVVEALAGGAMRFIWDEPGTKANFHFYESLYEPRDWTATTSDRKNVEHSAMFNDGGHIEVAGRIRGTFQIGDDFVEIDTLAHRDRSWGFRDSYDIPQARQISGSVGPEMSWSLLEMQMGTGEVRSMGFIVRNGRAEEAVSVRSVIEIGIDGVSIFGANVRVTLEGGEIVNLRLKVEQGFLTTWPVDVNYSQNLASVYWNGLRGFSSLDVRNNPYHGVFRPTGEYALLPQSANGLERCTDFDSWNS